MDNHESLINLSFKLQSIDQRIWLEKKGLIYTVSCEKNEGIQPSESDVAFFKDLGMDFKYCSGHLSLSGKFRVEPVLAANLSYIFERMETAYRLFLQFSYIIDPLPFHEAFPGIMILCFLHIFND